MFDAELMKEILCVHKTQLARWREAGLASELVEVETEKGTQKRRLYSLESLAGILAGMDRLPPCILKAAGFGAVEVLYPFKDNWEDIPPLTNSPEHRHFALGYVAGMASLLTWVNDIAPALYWRLKENMLAKIRVRLRHIAKLEKELKETGDE